MNVGEMNSSAFFYTESTMISPDEMVTLLEAKSDEGRRRRSKTVSLSSLAQDGPFAVAEANGKYEVKLCRRRRKVSCECADYQHRRLPCKHILSLAQAVLARSILASRA